MNEINKSYNDIDRIIEKIDRFKNEPIFSDEKNRRQEKRVSNFLDENEVLKTLSYLIAYSQNANSELVEKVINAGYLDKAFEGFNIEKVVALNPCDIADNYWTELKGIRQQAKLFHIVSLARKINALSSFKQTLNEINIPKTITSSSDIVMFWTGFNKLLRTLKDNKIPFFQSTTSLLHLLLEIGYDCVKPDLIVMKVAQKLNIVDIQTGDKNFRKTVKVIQEYSVDRNIRPSIVDFYFLIDEGQLGAKKFVTQNFYDNPK